MKKSNLVKKVIYIFLIALIMLLFFVTCSFASDRVINPDRPISISDQPYTFLNMTGEIVGIIRMVGVVVSVLVLAIIGINYMIKSPEGKADYKSNMIPYIVGAVVLFGGVNLVQFFYNMFY